MLYCYPEYSHFFVIIQIFSGVFVRKSISKTRNPVPGKTDRRKFFVKRASRRTCYNKKLEWFHMFLQGPNVSSIFAAQTIKQPKRMTVKQCNFKVGEVYLFHTDDPRCPDAESLWGLYDKHDGGSIRLESCSTDQKHFSKGWHLPEQYRFCRLSTRGELRDYMANSIYSEIKGLS